MPRYEYRCRACGDTFEKTRPMSQASDPASCPQGHDDTVKLLSTVAVGGRAGLAWLIRAAGRRVLRRRLRLRRLTSQGLTGQGLTPGRDQGMWG